MRGRTELGQAPLEQASLGVVADQCQRALVGDTCLIQKYIYRPTCK